ncbi:hypothetical protein GCM10010433_27850 [Streptomyces pulveraceus]
MLTPPTGPGPTRPVVGDPRQSRRPHREVESEGWRGEAEGIKVILAGAGDKRTQIDRQSQKGTSSLGIPATGSGDLE